MEDVDYKKFIKNVYNDTYDEYVIEHASSNRAPSDAVMRYARQAAIDKSFVESLIKYDGKEDQEDLWACIADIHKIHVANLEEYSNDEDVQIEILHRCLSAHQSWIKSSGHAFERYISCLDNTDLQDNEIRFILQKELTQLIKNDQLSNTVEDIAGLKSWGKDFDLYAIQTIHKETHVFGCIQSKTSIRDRVGRDVGFSNNAMDGLFWSAAVTFDGTFLNMPEFINMVNGGGSYPENGWHGMYAFSGISENNGRIYKTDQYLKLFANHAIQAARQFISDRRRLNRSWIAE